MKRYYVEVAPGGLECRVIGPDGWQGPWRSTEPHGRRQVDNDRRQRKILMSLVRGFGCALVGVVLMWLALALAGLVWLLRSVMGY
jgi:hypothetical protein